MMKEQRREFLVNSMQSVGIVLCSVSLMSLLQACDMNEDTVNTNLNTEPFLIDLTKPEFLDLQPIGGAVYYNEPSANGGNDIVIIRLEQTKFLVVSAICTHQGCSVNLPTIDQKTLVCPCHNAEFSPLTGEVLVQPKQGIATPLPVFKNEFNVSDNILTIYLPIKS